MKKDKRQLKQSRHRRIRTRIRGTATCPRLSVFRSHLHIWVQLIDDVRGKTLAAASDRETKKTVKGIARGEQVGELIAQRAAEKGIAKVVFDRGGYKYHGLVKAVAEGARKKGLTF